MTVKQSVLQKLEANRDRTLSGQELAEELHVTRTAVWKAIRALRQEGYPISAVTNQGYSLSHRSDKLSGEGIRAFLRPGLSDLSIYSYDTIDSTNEEARRLSLTRPDRPLLVVSNQQQKGKSRNADMPFSSPPDAGIYMSLYLPLQASLSRVRAGLDRPADAVSSAISALTGQQPRIRDHTLYLHGHKICGILTEANLLLEPERITSLVIGIGIYTSAAVARQEDMIALPGASDSADSFSRTQLIAEIVNRLLEH